MFSDTNKIAKIIFTVFIALYFISFVLNPLQNMILNGFLLSIHEAGHFVFIPFGEFIHVLGGTIFQIMIPVLFAVYFFLKKEIYSASFLNLLLGASLINASIYVRDAKNMALDLVVGDIHDWNYILSNLGILKYYSNVADIFYALGVFLVIFSLYIMFYFSIKKEV